MLYGLPVIATDILANQDAIGDDNYPYLFPIGDHQYLYQKKHALVLAKNFSQLANANAERVMLRHNAHQFKTALETVLF